MNYDNVVTCVFTPLEYGAVGMTEVDAQKAPANLAPRGERSFEERRGAFKEEAILLLAWPAPRH